MTACYQTIGYRSLGKGIEEFMICELRITFDWNLVAGLNYLAWRCRLLRSSCVRALHVHCLMFACLPNSNYVLVLKLVLVVGWRIQK